MKKVFRVFISETLKFHHDIEANSAFQAKELVRDGFRNNSDEEILPVEDQELHTGYQVEDAVEIAREESDLA